MIVPRLPWIGLFPFTTEGFLVDQAVAKPQWNEDVLTFALFIDEHEFELSWR